MSADWLKVAADAAQEAQHAPAELSRCKKERDWFAAAIARAEQWKARWEHDSTDAYNARINEAVRHLEQQNEVQP